jgi:hypothetical protein
MRMCTAFYVMYTALCIGQVDRWSLPHRAWMQGSRMQGLEDSPQVTIHLAEEAKEEVRCEELMSGSVAKQ